MSVSQDNQYYTFKFTHLWVSIPISCSYKSAQSMALKLYAQGYIGYMFAESKQETIMLNLEFGTEGTGDSHSYIEVVLPQGKTNQELLVLLSEEFKVIEKELHGTHCHVGGRITTPMSMWLGHSLAHITKSVAMYDPKEGKYITVISH